MRHVLVSFVLLSALACGQSSTTSTASTEAAAKDVAAGQEATEAAEAAPAVGQEQDAAGEVEKLEDEQTEE